MKTIDPSDIFLMETMIDSASVSRVLQKIEFSYFISMPPLGRRGGLIFCWRLNFCFKVLGQSQHFFHLEMVLGEDDPSFLCFLVYGPAVWKEKLGFWNDLIQLNRDEQQPWFCMGDFNDIISPADKQGG